jgi:hypothetical protein
MRVLSSARALRIARAFAAAGDQLYTDLNAAHYGFCSTLTGLDPFLFPVPRACALGYSVAPLQGAHLKFRDIFNRPGLLKTGPASRGSALTDGKTSGRIRRYEIRELCELRSNQQDRVELERDESEECACGRDSPRRGRACARRVDTVTSESGLRRAAPAERTACSCCSYQADR